MLQIKRIYEQPRQTDGLRILVDRLWPRGISKEKASIDSWLKEIAPSSELRVWFAHKPERFEEFSQKYRQELHHNPAIQELKNLLAHHHNATLLYAAKDPKINHALVLRNFLEKSE